MILITGATGNVGSELTKKLSRAGYSARVFVRNRTNSQSIALPGVQFISGDFTKPQTFARALQDVHSLFLLIPSSSEVEEQQRAFVDAAERSGVKHIVKLSQFGADARSPARFPHYHGAIEEHIIASGIPFTFLRPNLFMQGLFNFAPTIASRGELYAAAGNAKISAVDARDIAAVALLALTRPGHEGKIYDITGPEALTFSEMADRLAAAIGKHVTFVDITPDSMKQTLLAAGMPAWQAEGVVEDFDLYRNGEAARVTTTVENLTGRPPVSLLQFARDFANAFRSKAVGAA
jgi:uncharacterized protein YbjT (DUF2867 family)